jgi:hypothetical protein
MAERHACWVQLALARDNQNDDHRDVPDLGFAGGGRPKPCPGGTISPRTGRQGTDITDIAQDQADAAQRWYKDYVMGIIGAHDPEARRSGKAPDLHAAMLSRTEAIGRCKTVRHSLGLCGEVRLRLLLVDELSFSAIAAILLPGDVNGRKKVAAQMVLLLQQLTELYDRIDRAKMKRPST